MPEATSSPTNGNGPGKAAGDDALQKRVDEGPKGGARTWYEVLDVSPGVSATDLKKAYDRALALVEGRSIGGYLMLDPLAADSARADVEAAYRVLGDAERRAAYDQALRADESGEGEPAEAAPSKSDASSKSDAKTTPPRAAETVPDRDAIDDDDARDARTILAVAEAQAPEKPKEAGERPAADTVPPRTLTPASLKFLAPTVTELKPASPSSSGIRFVEPPQSEPEARVTDDRVSVGRVDEASGFVGRLSPSATIPPEAAMPAPERAAGTTPAPSGQSGQTLPPMSSTNLPGPATVAPTAALPEGAIDGEVIREIRLSRGLTLDQVADATKIRKPYLKAIEENDIPNLPARVYLRGFLTQVGRVLKVDRARLAEGYLQFVERSSGTPGSAG